MAESVEKGQKADGGTQKSQKKSLQMVDVSASARPVKKKNRQENGCGQEIAVEKEERRGDKLQRVFDDGNGEPPKSSVEKQKKIG